MVCFVIQVILDSFPGSMSGVLKLGFGSERWDLSPRPLVPQEPGTKSKPCICRRLQTIARFSRS
jgi:hypothetical protein